MVETAADHYFAVFSIVASVAEPEANGHDSLY
jgi:hypothetical protein